MRGVPLLAVLLIAACGPVGTDDTGATSPVTTSPITTSPVATSPITTSPVTTSPIGDGTAPPGTLATVVTVFDGDSFAVTTASGPDEVRLLGIDAPESGECFADRARDLLTSAAGNQVTLVGTDRDRYGRLLAHAYVGSTELGQWMLAQGAAIALSVEHGLRPDHLAAEQDAVVRGVGWWASDACGDLPYSGVFVYDVEFDAPGRDDENPNGEFVVIGNQGSDADLTGWRIRDESSQHRFTFPHGFILRSGDFVMVRSGCGSDGPLELYWCADGPVWNNDGDTALLLGPDGSFVSRLRYFGD